MSDPLADARGLAEAGRSSEACDLYERFFEFATASEVAEQGGDLARALRNGLEAGDAARVQHLRRRIVEGATAEALLGAAAAYEKHRLHADAAECLELAGELARAAELWRRAMEPARAGRLEESLGRYREAGMLYEAHLREHPDDVTVALHLGRILCRFGRHEAAIPYLQRAQNEPSLQKDALAELVAAFASSGMDGAAQASFRRLRGLDASLPQRANEFLRQRTERDDERTRADDEHWLVGRYRLYEVLGSGGMGQVRRAIDDFTGREVAIKIFHAVAGRRGAAFERFLREARIVKALAHPNVVAVYEFNADLGFIVMEFMAGGTLESLLDERKRLPGTRVRTILRAVTVGLEAAHLRGIIHRDIKPGNIFFGAANEVKIGDFGVAHLQELGATQTGSFIGTLAYMAPEQITGARLSFAADLYALGVTAYRMLAGRLPFEGADQANAHLSQAPPPLREHCPEAPPEVGELLDRLLAKDPEARYRTMAELRAAIEAIDWQFSTDTRSALPTIPLPAPTGAPGPADGAPSVELAGGQERYASLAAAEMIGGLSVERATDRRLDRVVVLERAGEEMDEAERQRWLLSRQKLSRFGSIGLQKALHIDLERYEVVLERMPALTLADRVATEQDAVRRVLLALEVAAAVARSLGPVHAAGGALGDLSLRSITAAAPWTCRVAGATSWTCAAKQDVRALWRLVAVILAGGEDLGVAGPSVLLETFDALLQRGLPPAARELLTAPDVVGARDARALTRPLAELEAAARDRVARLERIAELRRLARGDDGEARAFVEARSAAWEISSNSARVSDS